MVDAERTLPRRSHRGWRGFVLSDMNTTKRVVVFVDAQNFYRSARRAFFGGSNLPYRLGQFHPWRLGELLSARDAGRELVDVRIYTGRPDAYLQPAAYRANVQQCAAWEHAGCYVFTRPLRYPPRWPRNTDGRRPEEKGIDVAMALDIVRLAGRGEYDVGIICSADSDLAPAIEDVLDSDTPALVEVAGWRSEHYRQRLSLKGRNLWCHWLALDDYQRVRDETHYPV